MIWNEYKIQSKNIFILKWNLRSTDMGDESEIKLIRTEVDIKNEYERGRNREENRERGKETGKWNGKNSMREE